MKKKGNAVFFVGMRYTQGNYRSRMQREKEKREKRKKNG